MIAMPNKPLGVHQRKAKRKNEESQIQRDILHRLAWHGFQGVHVPNGSFLQGDAKRRSIQMASLKRDGLKVGFPDLIIFHRKDNRVCFFEVKSQKGKLQETQAECIHWLKTIGHNVAIVRSVDDADKYLKDWNWI